MDISSERIDRLSFEAVQKYLRLIVAADKPNSKAYTKAQATHDALGSAFAILRLSTTVYAYTSDLDAAYLKTRDELGQYDPLTPGFGNFQVAMNNHFKELLNTEVS